MFYVFYNGEFIPKYPVWVPLLGHGYKLVNRNRPTHPIFHNNVGGNASHTQESKKTRTPNMVKIKRHENKKINHAFHKI
jgi:hypothetical protein